MASLVMNWGMQLLLLLLLVAHTPEAPPATDQPAATFRTDRSLSALEKCLTEKLSQRGDVTAINSEGYVTLMYREGKESPMMIDLAPPNVRVTTKMTYGTGYILKSCL